MIKLIKKELIGILQKRGGISKQEAVSFINAFYEVIKERLAQNYEISLRGFGVFYSYFVRERKFKTNFMLLEKKVKPHFKPRFRISSILDKEINE